MISMRKFSEQISTVHLLINFYLINNIYLGYWSVFMAEQELAKEEDLDDLEEYYSDEDEEDLDSDDIQKISRSRINKVRFGIYLLYF
jgi:hypothetical protein